MVSHTSGLLGAQARNLSFDQPGVDFLQMQRYRTSGDLQNCEGIEKQKLIALATAAEQLERRAEQKLYKYFINNGNNHQESLSRANYIAKSQTDELLEDQRFQQAFANMYNAQVSGR